VQQTAKKYLSLAEYLAREDAAEYKSEYYRGEVCAMATGGLNHARIMANFLYSLDRKLKGSDAESFVGDVKIHVESEQWFTYPHIMAIRGEPRFYEGRDDTVTNPWLAANIRFDTSRNDDSGERFRRYRALASLQEYFMIDQHAMHVLHYSRLERLKWRMAEHWGEEEILHIASHNLEIPLHEIYDRVKFAQQKNRLKQGEPWCNK
jgi:Uma2 family endonuclease